MTNLDLNVVIVLNFAFTFCKNILNFTKDKIQQFLDASKAFDRIDHWRFFTILIDKHVPLFVIIILVF